MKRIVFFVAMLTCCIPVLHSQDVFKLVIDYQFDEAGSFYNGYPARVKKNGEEFYIDKYGKSYDNKIIFYDGLAAVEKNGKWGFIDKTGKVVIDYQFDKAYGFSEDLAAVEKDGKWGHIDRTGRLIINYQFDKAYGFSEGLAAVEKNGKWGFIDKTGKVVINYQFDNIRSFDSNSFASVGKNGKQGIVDRTGKLVVDCQYDELVTFFYGFAVKRFGTWEFIDQTGKLVSDGYEISEFYYCSQTDGLICVKKDGKYGYIDHTGKLVISCRFDSASRFSEGLAAVEKNGKWGFIDKTGKVVIDYQFYFAYNFSEGLAQVVTDKFTDKCKYGYINKTGKLVIDYQFDFAYHFSEGLAAVEKNGKWGFIALYTLTERIREYVETGILEWQKKGEFEKTADYILRVNEQARNAKIEELTAEAIDHIKKEYMQTILSADMALKEYDADNETYLISSNSLGDFTIPVPFADAPSFKQNFAQTKFGEYDFSIADDVFHLARLTISNPANGKKYYYDSKQPVTYAANNIVYNFSPIEVDLPKGAPQPKGAHIESKTTVVGLADVDVNIPVSNKTNPHAYALIIGNEDYKSFQTSLESEVNVAFAENDARIFEKYCSTTLGVPKSNIQLLINATSGQMLQAIDWINKLIEKEGGEAEVIIYYAGHGLPDEKSREPYIIPVDVSGTNLQHAIKLQDLYTGLTKHSSQKITVFMDACFTGGGREQGLLAARGVRIKPKEESLEGNIVVFTSSSGEQSSLPYKEKQHGMFTYHLLKKIQETAGNISYDDLYSVLRKTVDLESVKHNQKEQTPNLLYPPNLEEKWKKWTLK